MEMKKYFYLVLVIFGFAAILWLANLSKPESQSAVPPPTPPPAEEPVENPAPTAAMPAINTTGLPLKLPLNFSIAIFANDLVNPRDLLVDHLDNVLVSVPAQGKVLALWDTNQDGRAEYVTTLLGGLNRPHGLAYQCNPDCILYVAETNAVSQYNYDPKKRTAANRKKLLDLPTEGNHITRSLILDPVSQGKRLLISVGSTCNVCKEADERRAAVLSLNLIGGDSRVFAKGLRNSVFLTAHPLTGEVWATDMGRDHLGDDLPPDEINIIRPDRHYGWPYCYGKNIIDADSESSDFVRFFCNDRTASGSYIDIPAHSAPLGLAFFPETRFFGWPEEYRYNLLVAYHGSWNRSVPTGYKVVRYRLDSAGNYSDEVEDFISGWLTQDNQVLGRPADIEITPSGRIYISDDKAGVIYLVKYHQ